MSDFAYILGDVQQAATERASILAGLKGGQSHILNAASAVQKTAHTLGDNQIDPSVLQAVGEFAYLATAGMTDASQKSEIATVHALRPEDTTISGHLAGKPFNPQPIF